jgi:hypothetical protein
MVTAYNRGYGYLPIALEIIRLKFTLTAMILESGKIITKMENY